MQTNLIKLVPFDIIEANDFFKLIDKNRNFLRKRLAWLDNTNKLEDTKKFILSCIK